MAYVKRTQLETAALMARIVQHDAVPSPGPGRSPGPITPPRPGRDPGPDDVGPAPASARLTASPGEPARRVR